MRFFVPPHIARIVFILSFGPILNMDVCLTKWSNWVAPHNVGLKIFSFCFTIQLNGGGEMLCFCFLLYLEDFPSQMFIDFLFKMNNKIAGFASWASIYKNV